MFLYFLDFCLYREYEEYREYSIFSYFLCVGSLKAQIHICRELFFRFLTFGGLQMSPGVTGGAAPILEGPPAPFLTVFDGRVVKN